MTTPLPEPAQNLKSLIAEYWDIAYTDCLTQISQGSRAQEKLNAVSEAIKAYGAAEYARAISDAVEILSDTRENTRYDALQEIRKLGETS